MAEMSGADKQTGVLEIGPGIGVLTAESAKAAKKVVAIELDKRLLPVLDETLAPYGNVEVIPGDALKIDLNALIREKFAGMKAVVCANLPYYITSPMIMYLLESRIPVEKITVMVQKEAAERLCAQVGSREAGAVTVAVNYYAEARRLFDVSSSSFLPAPKVDSSVIQLAIRPVPAVTVTDEKFFFCMIKAAFSQRRKTAQNSIGSGLSVDKGVIRDALAQLGLSQDVRAEKLTMQELAELSNLLSAAK